MLTRREFLKSMLSLAPVLISPGLISSCSRVISPDEKKPPDISLESDIDQVSYTVKNQFDRLNKLVSEGRSFRVGFPADYGSEVLEFSFVSNDAASYKHLRVVRESDGSAVNLVWGSKNLSPSVKFTDDAGNTLVIGGRELEISLSDVFEGWSDLSSGELLKLGIKMVAIGFAVWLGAKVASLFISAISFLAFNALVLGLLIVGATIVITILKWIIEKTGWTVSDVEELFRQTLNYIINLINEIINFIKSFLGRT